MQASATPRLRLPSFQLPNMPSWEQPTRSTLPHNVLISGPINACCPRHAYHAQLRRGRNKRYQIRYGTHQVQSAKPSFRCLFPAPRGLPRLVVLEEKAGGALTGWRQRNRAHRGIQSRLQPGAASLVHGTNSVTIQPPIQGVTAEFFNACQAAVLVLSHQSSPFPFLSTTAYIEWISAQLSEKAVSGFSNDVLYDQHRASYPADAVKALLNAVGSEWLAWNPHCRPRSRNRETY